MLGITGPPVEQERAIQVSFTAKIRPSAIAGLPGTEFGQKTKLNVTSGFNFDVGDKCEATFSHTDTNQVHVEHVAVTMCCKFDSLLLNCFSF